MQSVHQWVGCHSPKLLYNTPMTKFEKNDPDRPRRIEIAYKSSADFCDKLQKHHTSESAKYGYARDLFQNAAGQFGEVSDNPSLGPHEEAVKKVRDYLEFKAGQIKPEMVDISSVAFTSTTSTSISTSTTTPMGILPGGLEWLKPPPWVKPDESQRLAIRLEKLNPELGKCLRGAWECFHGNSEQPERAALGLMRQLFDHLLDALAPKKKVQDWLSSQGRGKASVTDIHRDERGEYVLTLRANNPDAAGLLKAQTAQLLQAYADLQHLHKRGTLNRENIRLYLNAMQGYIEQLADICGL